MQRINAKQLALGGFLAALVMVGTMMVQIPTPSRGYIHAGDSMVYLCGIILGPTIGSLAAAVGSLLADISTGYGIYAPATFVIKGIDALVVGGCYKFFGGPAAPVGSKVLVYSLAVVAGGSLMVTGYLAYEAFLYGFAVALLGIPGNITQALGGGILALPLLLLLEKIKGNELF